MKKLEEYLDLITHEHATKPKFIKYNKAYMEKILSCTDVVEAFNIYFNLDEAAGDQLDKIGYNIGINRVLPVNDPDIPPVLDDETYRLVIKSKIQQNHWNGTLDGWNKILKVIFPDSAYDIQDNFDMTVTVMIIDPNFNATKIALLLRGYLLPKPSGVRLNYIVVDSPLFGWDTESSFIGGWDDGKWSTT